VEGRGVEVCRPDVSFWWIKPLPSDPHTLDPLTLPCNSSGPNKNTPGRSHAVYEPLAALFRDASASSELRFGLERSAGGAWRATMRNSEQLGARYLLLVWQEAWTSNPFALKKFIKGKLLYQKDGIVDQLYACPYRIDDDAVTVDFAREERSSSHPHRFVLPPDHFKLGCI